MSVPPMIGRYRIGPTLGAGGYAVVWLAHDESLDTPIAIKVLAENWVAQADLRERFLAEARMLRRAASTRIVQVFDIGELSDGRPYFVMEYADLGTLADRIAKRRLSLVEALRLTAEVARGAAELHRLDIVHRDLKPSNVLIRTAPDGSERLMIADLGIAKNIAQGSALTLSVGSTGYMAPEQSMPDSRVDARADVYSLGALGFQLVTGRQPGTWGPALPADGTDPDFPDPVLRLLRQTLVWEPEGRWPDAASLADRLDDLADEYESGDQAEIGRRPAGSNRVEILPGPGRRSDSGRRSASGRRAASGLHVGAAGASGGMGRLSHSMRDRRVVLTVGLIVAMLIWIEFRNLHSSAAGTEIQASPAASPTAKPSVTPTSVAPLADGPHDGLLVASANGKVTFNLVNRLLRDEALAKCQQDLGSIPADAVCRSYYFPRLEVDPRTLPVAKNSTVGYVIKVDRQGVLFGQLTGADLGKLTALSKPYQQGRLFNFHTKNGVFLGGSQYPLGCKEVPGLIVDGSAEWMSKCVVQDGLR